MAKKSMVFRKLECVGKRRRRHARTWNQETKNKKKILHMLIKLIKAVLRFFERTLIKVRRRRLSKMMDAKE